MKENRPLFGGYRGICRICSVYCSPLLDGKVLHAGDTLIST